MSQISPTGVILKNKSVYTWYFSCKNALEQKKFEKFQRADTSLVSVVLFTAVTTVVSLALKGISFRYYPTSFNLFCVIIGIVSEILISMLLLYYIHQYRIKLNDKRKETFRAFRLIVLENLFVVGRSLSLVVFMIAVLINGYCVDLEINATDNRQVACNGSRRHQLPEAIMPFILIYPMMVSMVVKSAKSEVIFLTWFASFIAVLVVIVGYEFQVSFGPFIMLSVVTFIVLYEYQRQKIATYFLAQELMTVKSENERLAEENRASELKHLIGNVAHDLKTPLSSLNMGIDLISSVISELAETTVSSISKPLTDILLGYVSAVEENLVNMKNVSAFMLMNINRCMDYTKASNGLKLVPKLETAGLLETIALPLHVMNAMHDGKVHIELRPVPRDICSHIITDKQWLQENILCLLSNAVKYSNRGTVTVSVSLADREQEIENNLSPHSPQPKIEKNEIEMSESRSSSAGKGKQKPFMYLQPWRQKPEDKYVEVHSISYEALMHHGLTSPSQPGLSRSSTNSSNKSLESFAKSASLLRVEVEDTGIGLSDELMNNLFSAFKQAQRLAGGTGLGLFSLSRRIDAVGGRYGVMRRSDGQQGSVFWFEIPYKPDEEFATNMSELSVRTLGTLNSQVTKKVGYNVTRAVNTASIDTQPPTPTPLVAAPPTLILSPSGKHTRKALNILLADDTLSIQKMTSMLLRRQGHTVTIAENGAEALEMVTAKYTESAECRLKGLSCDPFDVVLMDFQMPTMDGLEATRRIRSLELKLLGASSDMVVRDIDAPNFHQLIIGLSANSDEETVQLARDAGVDDFMEKPFKAAVFDEIWKRISPAVVDNSCTYI